MSYELLSPEFHEKLEEISQTLRVVNISGLERSYEIAEVNTHLPADEAVLHIATYSSGITINLGNAAELARQGLLDPTKRRVYVSTPGNGNTPPMSPQELADLAETGRLIRAHNGQGPASVLPTVQGIGTALSQEGIVPRYLTGDSMGASIITALMAGLESESIRAAYLNARPNISDHSPVMLAARMLLVENIIHAGQDRGKSKTDPFALHRDDFAQKRAAEEVLHDHALLSSAIRHLPSHIAYARALSRGPRAGDPALHDTEAAFVRQPNAELSYSFSHADTLQRDHDVESFIERAQSLGPVALRWHEGGHGWWTWRPSERAEAERDAFARAG